MFGILLRYSGDVSTTNQSPFSYVLDLYKLVKHKDLMVDELFCQLVKQTTKNPSE